MLLKHVGAGVMVAVFTLTTAGSVVVAEDKSKEDKRSENVEKTDKQPEKDRKDERKTESKDSSFISRIVMPTGPKY